MFKIPHYGFRTSRGFTLVELLISISVIGILIVGITDFYFTILSFRIKNQTIAEVELQGTSTMRLLSQRIRNAESITSPAIGTSNNLLTLAMASDAIDPTIVDNSSNRLRITEGTQSPVFLTGTSVSLSNLTFTNLSRVSTPGIVRISFTLTRADKTGTNQYDYAKTFTTSAALR